MALFLDVFLEKDFGFLIEFFSERFWKGDAEGVDVGEATVPGGAGDGTESHHASNRLQDSAPSGVKVDAARLQRHRGAEGG